MASYVCTPMYAAKLPKHICIRVCQRDGTDKQSNWEKSNEGIIVIIFEGIILNQNGQG